MAEQELQIIANGEHKNINLKPKLNKGIAGLEEGNHVIVEKVFAEGYENDGKFGKSYSCKVKYKGEEVSFWLTEKEHEVYKTIGGVEDKVKITLTKENYVNKNTGVETRYNKLVFEAA